tara:strand:+ start:154 stop:807 length:654 start_codon:yes stop_codon:yes gene_type:complete
MNKRLFIALTLILLLTTYKLGNEINLNLGVKKIIIENNNILSEKQVKEDLLFLYEKNLFFLNNNLIKKQIDKNSLIESFKIKKIYPNTVKIQVFEKEPVFILQNKKKRYYFTKKNLLINYTNIKKFEDLPIVFAEKENFEKFYSELKKIKFPIKIVKAFYFFDSKRWDLLTVNNKTIKLPIKDYDISLKNFINIQKKESFKKYTIFDYRITDQLILK